CPPSSSGARPSAAATRWGSNSAACRRRSRATSRSSSSSSKATTTTSRTSRRPNMTTEQRPRHPRYAIRLSAELRVGNQLLTGVTRNLSAGGVCVEIDRPLEEGSKLRLTLFVVEDDVEAEGAH